MKTFAAAGLIAASLLVILCNLRFKQLYSIDSDTVDAFLMLEAAGWHAHTPFHPGLLLGFSPYVLLKGMAEVSRFDAMRLNFAFYGCLAVLGCFAFAFVVTRDSLRAAACTLLFSLTPAVQFVERFLDDNFPSYGFLFLVLTGLLSPGPPTTRLTVRVAISLLFFPPLLLFQPGFLPCLIVSGLGMIYMTFLFDWTWKDRLRTGALTALAFTLSACFTFWALGAWLGVSVSALLHGMGSAIVDTSSNVASQTLPFVDRRGSFAFGLKHSIFAGSILHSLDLNDLSYVLIGYDRMKGDFTALALGIAITIFVFFRGWKTKSNRDKFNAVTGASGLVVLCAIPYAAANLVSQQERFDLLTVLLPFLLARVSFQGQSPWSFSNVWILSLLAAIFLAGSITLLTPSSPESSWQRMKRILPEAPAASYLFAEGELRNHEDSVSLAMLGALPLSVIENPQGPEGVLAILRWMRPRYLISIDQARTLDLHNTFVSAEARNRLASRP
ncbi:MAG TPA: hypothetical protein PKE49_13555 [Leptospiraceae bacterium]|nr:hypothetical protein [Leptospirales bacterium]HMX57545.1 hypothetical protein [Leptospiraceae bacterium]HNL01198.1 hypothetical protein [Leptospiraceae bacterium]HNL69086.1 hypothetical protein [Leptospiraceae bacterium]HNN60660.1 hypothetical protein [Leptospiraceae bacterium]